jgi:F-type H+-transporting ATPase subunit delta
MPRIFITRVNKIDGIKNMQILTHGPEKRYAKALVELLTGSSKKDVESVKAVLAVLGEMAEIQAFLSDSSQSAEDKTMALQALASGVKATEMVSNFLMVMGDKGRSAYVETTLKLAISMLGAKDGQVVAEVRTAEALTKGQKEALTAFVKDGHKGATDILIEEVVDPSVIAGVTLTVGSKQYDNSLKGALSSFAQSMSNK